jgi:pimeloyl-ACP methyl ester carboxylesterase
VSATADTSAPAGTGTVVLVHGACHGAWCWDRVVEQLSSRDVSVIAVDLPGHGEHPGPLGDLYGDAAHVVGILDGLDAPVVLVGHSYGGAVITQAGDHRSVSHLVFLCALNLDEGEDCSVAVGPEGTDEWSRLASGLVPDENGNLTVDPSVAAECFYGDCDAATTEWALARLGPQPLAAFTQSPTTISWRQKPSTYVICSDDMAIPPAIQRRLASRCTTSIEWTTSHSPFLSRPELVTALVSEVLGH